MNGQIEKRGESVYRLRWYRHRSAEGKRVYGSEMVKGTRAQAEERMREILTRKDKGYAVPSQVPTLREYLEGWKLGQAAAALRPRTLRVYLDLLDRHVLPALGDVSLRALHAERIEREVVAPLRKSKPPRLRTAQLAVAALSKVLRSAVRDRTLGLVANPCHGVEVGKVEPRSVQPMTAEERERFRAAIAGDPNELLFLLLMGTGLRPGEALALGWQHVDLAVGAVRVERTVDDEGVFQGTKTEKARRLVPLPANVVRALVELKRGPSVGLLVFHDRKGGPLDQKNLLRRHFRPALARAGITRSLRVYDLRHGYATAALEAGADVRTTADLLGHSSTRLTLDTYTHVTDERKRDAADRIGARLFGAEKA